MNDNFLPTDGYNLVRADHPRDVERRGLVKRIPVRATNIRYFEDAGLSKLAQKMFVSVVYRSLSQTNYESN